MLRYLSFLILGIGMVIYSFKRGKFVERLQEFDTKQIIKLALIGGLDCFFVGVGCYYMNLPYLMESLVLVFNCTCWLYDSLFILDIIMVPDIKRFIIFFAESYTYL